MQDTVLRASLPPVGWRKIVEEREADLAIDPPRHGPVDYRRFMLGHIMDENEIMRGYVPPHVPWYRRRLASVGDWLIRMGEALGGESDYGC